MIRNLCDVISLECRVEAVLPLEMIREIHYRAPGGVRDTGKQEDPKRAIERNFLFQLNFVGVNNPCHVCSRHDSTRKELGAFGIEEL